MVMMMDVEVLELCTSTVAKMPIIRPQTGFCINSLLENAWPAKIKHKPTLFNSIIKKKKRKQTTICRQKGFLQ